MSGRWQRLAGAAVIAAVVLVAYGPALHGGFLWDDDTLLTESALVKAPDGLRRIWLTTEPLDYWPITNTSFWVEWRLWGMAPAGYHATNLGLHVASALILWAVLRQLSIPGAYLAAVLFAVHPVNVESIAWIAQRKNALSMFFFLASVFCWGQTRVKPGSDRDQTGVRPWSDPWYWASLIAFVCGMLSKGSIAILPGVLLLIAWWQRGAITRAEIIRTAPFLAVAVALTIVNIWFQGHLATGPIRHATIVERALGAGAVVWFYLSKALAPVGLVFVYPQWQIRADDIRWWLPSAAAAAVTLLLVWQRHRPIVRAALFGWLFFCLALLPVMGFADVYYMTYSLVADHYQHVALVGVVAAAAAGLARLASSWRIDVRGAAACGAVIVAVFAVGTWRQARLYASAETLYRATLEKNPSCWLIHNLLGVLLADRSLDEAIAHFREALRLQPDLLEAHNNLCLSFHRTGRTDETIAECSAALKINPRLPVAHNALGAALAARGRTREARAAFESALALDPRLADAHNNLGNILASTGLLNDAASHYREALSAAPGFAAAHVNLGFALERQGRANEAIQQYQEALRIEPGRPDARARLEALQGRLGHGVSLAQLRAAVRAQPDRADVRLTLADALLEGANPQEALEEYRAALKVMPESAPVHSGIASALESLGRPTEAEPEWREAIRLKPDSSELHKRLGDLLHERGALEDARREYIEALRYDARSAEAHNNLGVVLARLGRRDEAIAHLKTAIDLQPDYADARRNLERVMGRK